MSIVPRMLGFHRQLMAHWNNCWLFIISPRQSHCCPLLTGDFFSSFLVATNLAFTAKFFSLQSDTKSIIYDLLNLSIFSPCFPFWQFLYFFPFFYTFLFWTMMMQNKVVTCRTPKSKWQIQKRQAGSPLVVLTGCEDGLFRGVYSEHRGVHNEYLNCRHYLLLVAKMWRVSPCVQIKYINYPPKLQRWTIFSQSPLHSSRRLQRRNIPEFQTR